MEKLFNYLDQNGNRNLEQCPNLPKYLSKPIKHRKPPSDRKKYQTYNLSVKCNKSKKDLVSKE